MPLTAAEKQRRYRERLRVNNPEKFQAFRLKHAARNRERMKKICECKEDEKEIRRKQWRNSKREQRKNLKDPLTSTGQSAKLNERYKRWPRLKSKSISRPHLELAETDSNEQIDAEEVDPSRLTNTTTIYTAKSEPNDLSRSRQNDTPRRRRKHSFDQTLPQIDEVIDFTGSNRDEDDTDLLFKSYSKKLKTMTKRRQATIKFEIAKLMLKGELEECDEMETRLDNGQFVKNDMVITLESTGSCAGSDTNDTTFIKSSPTPVFENVDPFST